VELLEHRRLMTAPNLFIPSAVLFPPQDLQQAPVITSQNGSLDATMNMVRAGFTSDPILYGGEPILSSLPDPNSPNNPDKPVYAMAYQVDAYGTTYPAGHPGPTLQLQVGDTLNLHVIDNLADPNEPPNVVFDTNLHTHGLHVSDLNNGDNVYREITPGQGMNVSINVSAIQPPGVNWYHVHRHMSTHDQVYGGLSGLLMIGDPLDPWPQYKGNIQEVNMGITEVNIQNGHLTNYNAGAAGANFTNGWQKRINGQENPIIHIKPGETQVWNFGSIGPFGGANLAITDGNLQSPWNGTILVQDGNGQHLRPYSLSLAADPARMQDLAAATLIMPGNRLTLAVTAPMTPGTYYLIDGWGGQDKPAVNAAGQQQFYVLATIQVDGTPVTDPPPNFGPVGPIDPLFTATPDVQRTFEFSINPGATPAQNLFLINGKTFGNGVMPQVQIGTVEEWTLTNPINSNANANHPFHIHQGDFVVTAVNGVPVDPTATPPPADSSLAYISPRDVIDIPSGGSITIRFRALDFPGKYVFHCHILKHEDQGMMSPVLQFGPAEGLRMPFGTSHGPRPSAVVLNGKGDTLGVIHPFGSYRGQLVAAAALATSEFFETMAVGTGSTQSAVLVYENGSLKPSSSFRAFRGEAGRGVSLAVGDLNGDGSADVAVGSRGHGPATVRLFDTSGNLLREFKNILPGIFPHGVNVAIGDVNGDNFDDLVVSAGKGREPLVTALDGQDIANGVANPKTLFTFVAGGGARAGAKVAVGYVAPATIPSYLADVITTPEAGSEAGTVEVWNPADLGLDVSHGGMDMMTDMEMTMPDDSPAQDAPTASHHVPMPMASFRPFGRTRGAVDILSNYLSELGQPGVPVVASWQSPHKVAFSTISLDNKVTTQVRNL
jgi:FtsP/CotA-like multicopper oxidase with cupredoxin domain